MAKTPVASPPRGEEIRPTPLAEALSERDMMVERA